jgi:CRP-like cAMP-binding protein
MLKGMDHPDATSAIMRLPLFAGVPEAACARLAAAATPRRYRDGQPVFRRGDAGDDGMLLVQDGVVRIHLGTAGGREITLGLAGAGEAVGEMALIDGGARSADVTALTPVRGLMLRAAPARAVIGADPAVALALLQALATRLRRTSEQVEAIGLRSLTARLAAALLKLSAADATGLVRLNQAQIAFLVAASRPKVNGTLREFQRLGLVAPGAHGLRLVDAPGLRALAEAE